MALNSDALTLLPLGILGDKPVDPAQPALRGGIHLRWAPDQGLGFPWHGFYLFRRESDPNRPSCLRRGTFHTPCLRWAGGCGWESGTQGRMRRRREVEGQPLDSRPWSITRCGGAGPRGRSPAARASAGSPITICTKCGRSRSCGPRRGRSSAGRWSRRDPRASRRRGAGCPSSVSWNAHVAGAVEVRVGSGSCSTRARSSRWTLGRSASTRSPCPYGEELAASQGVAQRIRLSRYASRSRHDGTADVVGLRDFTACTEKLSTMGSDDTLWIPATAFGTRAPASGAA